MNKVQTWTRLAKRAEAQASSALVEVASVRRRLTELASSEARLHELRADYAARLQKVESAPHTMSQNMACRRYISHVESLLQKIAEAQAVAREALAQARAKHRAAEADRMKMQHLAESESARVLRAHKAREQKQLDQLAINRFNLR